MQTFKQLLKPYIPNVLDPRRGVSAVVSDFNSVFVLNKGAIIIHGKSRFVAIFREFAVLYLL